MMHVQKRWMATIGVIAQPQGRIQVEKSCAKEVCVCVCVCVKCFGRDEIKTTHANEGKEDA